MRLNSWLIAIRPKTLTVSVAPVLLGLAFAWRDGFFSPFYASITLLAAMLIQIGTNLCNDYFDFQKGADTSERIGPVRVTQAGLLPPKQVCAAFIFAFSLAACLGIALVLKGGWPILVIGILSILSGIAYTAGPYALAYLGLGEVFVLIFFGPVAVAGTYYVQALQFNFQAAFAGVAIGLLACAILIVNNLRDLEQDRKAGKNTLAVRFGKNFAHVEYLFCLLTPALIACWLSAYLSSLLVILAMLKMRQSSLSALLPQTALLVLGFSIMLAIEIS